MVERIRFDSVILRYLLTTGLVTYRVLSGWALNALRCPNMFWHGWNKSLFSRRSAHWFHPVIPVTWVIDHDPGEIKFVKCSKNDLRSGSVTQELQKIRMIFVCKTCGEECTDFSLQTIACTYRSNLTGNRHLFDPLIKSKIKLQVGA